MVNKMKDCDASKVEEGRETLCWNSLSNSVKTISDNIVKDYYEAESWQFSGCWD